MRKLISKKSVVICELSIFDYACYFEHYYLRTFFAPKLFQLLACGSLLGSFVNNLLEGYRTLVPIKISQNLTFKQKS
ncbi:MAG: hypothetical protein WC628_02365, partial [Candidatus Omnitrophota bacterium]